jgi:hypothetical protein
MKTFLLGAVTGAALLVVAAVLYLRLGFLEVRNDVGASSFENTPMTAAVHASVRRHAPESSNPVPPTDDNLSAGGKLFAGNCAGCHGSLTATEDNGDSLFPRVPQLHRSGLITPRRRFSGLPNTAFAAAACLPTESGCPTTNYGPSLPT